MAIRDASRGDARLNDDARYESRRAESRHPRRRRRSHEFALERRERARETREGVVALGDGGKGVDASGETGGATTQIVVDFVLGGGDVSRLHAPVVGDVGEKATVGARRERDGVANVVEIDERERGVGFVVELAR